MRLFCSLLILLLPLYGTAQTLPGLPDIPVDPRVLRNASPQELQKLLRDYNQRGQAEGRDMHRRLKRDTVDFPDTARMQPASLSPTPGIHDTYGANIFRNGPLLEVTELSNPPEDYPIGVGDHIIVSLWGGADFEQDYVVARDGSIFPEGLGKITLQGLTFANARAIVKDRFRRVVPPSTNISVTLGQPRSIVVQASGNVENPGPVVVSAFTNALNVVALAGGITEYGNLRNILISRNGKVIDSIDVYKYMNTGDFGKHLYLQNNDFVIVPFFEKKVLATGRFKRPMYYQMKAGEGVDDLVEFAGGFASDAYRAGLTILRTENDSQVIKSIDLSQHGDAHSPVALHNGDVVSIRPVQQGLKNMAIVRGEVNYPDTFEVRKGDRLFDVLHKAGGLTPHTFLERAFVYRGAADSNRISVEKVDVSLTDFNLNPQSASNIPIYDFDVIEVISKKVFAEKESVAISGEVRKPGFYRLYEGMTLKDLLLMANGIRRSAENGLIVVSSIVDRNDNAKGMKPTNTVVKTFVVKGDLTMDKETEQVLLKPYDQVFVRRNPNFRLQENIEIEGEVTYPGTYPRLQKNERISSFVQRAGGVTAMANPRGAILYRKRDTVFRVNPLIQRSVIKNIPDTLKTPADSLLFDPAEPISIDLAMAIQNPGSKHDLILQEDDRLYIPEVNPVVMVMGAVQSEIKMYFDKEHTNLSYYIDRAGGFGVRPWRSRIYVTYANGKSRRTRNFGFLHFYPRVEEGSIVVVPTRPEGKGFNNLAAQVVISSLPILLAYILTKQ